MDKKRQKITGLWILKDRKGGEYMSAKVDKEYITKAMAAMMEMEEPQILIYPFDLKNGKNKSPDLIMYIAEGKKKENSPGISRFKHQKNNEKPVRHAVYSKDFIYQDEPNEDSLKNKEDGDFPY